MMTRTFNRNHWLTQIAIEWGKLDPYSDTDICHFTRRAIIGVMSVISAVTIMIALACVVLWMSGMTLAAWAFLLMNGMAALGIIQHDPAPVITTGVLLIALIGMVGSWFKRWYRDYFYAQLEKAINNKVSPPSDNVIVQMYKSFKEKTCYRIELTSNEETDESH